MARKQKSHSGLKVEVRNNNVEFTLVEDTHTAVASGCLSETQLIQEKIK